MTARNMASTCANPLMLDVYFKTLSELMAAESRLFADFYRHRGKLGENREVLLQRFLATYLPRRFGVGTGFALFGSFLSTQQDVVVYDQLSNPVLFPDTAAPLFPPSAISAVVEVKSTLTKRELRKTVLKTQALKRELRASFANHPKPPRAEALAGLFAFAARDLSVAEVLGSLKDTEDEIGVEIRDRLDVVCVLGEGLVLGSSLFYATATNGQSLTANAPTLSQERVALAAENSLFLFYSRLLDYILGRGDVRPQLMSYLPPETPVGEVVAVG
jgi:hypothetical protein